MCFFEGLGSFFGFGVRNSLSCRLSFCWIMWLLNVLFWETIFEVETQPEDSYSGRREMSMSLVNFFFRVEAWTPFVPGPAKLWLILGPLQGIFFLPTLEIDLVRLRDLEGDCCLLL